MKSSNRLFRILMSFLLVFGLVMSYMPSFIYGPNIVYASEDSDAPVLNSFKILNSSVERPGVVQIQLDITEEDAGFSDFFLSLSWTDGGTKKSGDVHTGLAFGGGASGDMCFNYALAIDSSGKQFGEYTGTYIFNLYVGANANVSDYEITQLKIRDKEGNTNSYDGSNLSSIADGGNIIFSITGDNSNEDRIAPVLTGYEILTPSVSRPGVMKIALDIFEDDTGISDIGLSFSWTDGDTKKSGDVHTGLTFGGGAGGDMCFNFSLSIDPSGNQFGDKTGTYIFDLDIAEKANISEYSITEIWIRDKAGNRVSYSLSSLSSLLTNGANKFTLTGDASTDDVTAPVINSYEILNPIVNRPGVLKLKFDITEEESGLSDIGLSLSWTDGGTKKSGDVHIGLAYSGGAGGDMCFNYSFYNDNNLNNFGGKSGSYIFTLLIGEKADISTYSIDRIWIRDIFGNISEIANDSEEDNQMISYSKTGSNTFVLQDEFNYSFITGTNNPNLPQKLIDMPIGSAAKVEIIGDNILRKECLDAIKGTDKTIVAYSDSIQWIIRGNQLTGETKDLHLDVMVSALKAGDYIVDAGSTDTSYTVSDDAVKLVFYTNGVLPGKIQVRFKSDTLYDKGISGSALSLYYFDGSNLTFENDDCDLSFDGTDKWCYVNITHNSTFIVSTSSSFGFIGHNYGNLIAEVPATCTTDGMEAHYECSSCHQLFVKNGDEYVETTEEDLIISATGHNLTAHSAVAVTCSTDGNSAYWSCDRCNKYFSDATAESEIEPDSWIIKATGHNWKKPIYNWKLYNNEWTCTATLACANDDSEQIIEKVTAIGTSTTPATCSEKGITTYTATFTTNEAFVAQTIEKVDIEALGHEWGEPVYTWSDDNSQCTATRVCTRDSNHKETETAPAKVNTSATCTEPGTTTYTATFENCAFSVQTKEVAVDALDHDLVEHPAVQATCTSAGNIAYWSCSRCGLCYSDSLGNDIIAENSWIIPISKHSLTAHAAKEPTCTQNGNKEYWKCGVCNKTFSDAEGTTEITNYIISANGHSKVIDHAIASTTTSTGLTEGSHCSECGAIIKKQEVVPKIVGNQQSENQQQDNKQSENHKKDNQQPENQQQNNDLNTNDSSSNSDETSVPRYCNEWVNGKWYGSDGSQNYSGTLSWKSNSAGWWVEDSDGWYPVSCWQKIDGDWYYFDASGYMATNEYVDGYWLNSDGTCSNDYYLTWKSDSTGWWVEDKSGWWPSSKWLKINGSWYYFNSYGYMVTNQYVDGYWIGSDGVCN